MSLMQRLACSMALPHSLLVFVMCSVGALGEPPSWRSLLRGTDRRLQSQMPNYKLADGFGGVPGFYHGVASGDPLYESVVIWTRYTPLSADDVVEIEFRIAAYDSSLGEEAMKNLLTPEGVGLAGFNPDVYTGRVNASSESDWVVKIDVANLVAGRQYVYGFAVVDGSAVSPVGLTKTAPRGHVDSMVYALFSCSRWTYSYFHAYDVASIVKDLDFWVHVGDYIYELGSDIEDDRGEPQEPVTKLISLQDYRLRYATHRTDEALQNLHRWAPLIATWDDHEFADNAWKNGANRHEECTPESCPEGTWEARVLAAGQAYFEWLPIRKAPSVGGILEDYSPTQVIEWGDLATVVALDGRVAARSGPPTLGTLGTSLLRSAVALLAVQHDNVTAWREEPLLSQFQAAGMAVVAARSNPSYELLGAANMKILKDAFVASRDAGKPWQIHADAVMMAPLRTQNFNRLHEYMPGQEAQAAAIAAALYASEQPSSFTGVTVGGLMRLLEASEWLDIPPNSDDWNGFLHERNMLLDIFNSSTNNPIALGGDLHDAFAWTIYEEGDLQASGEPVVPNIGCPSVASPGIDNGVGVFYNGLGDFKYPILNAHLQGANPGLHYFNTKDKGFVAMKVTHTQHVAEFYFVNDDANSMPANKYRLIPYAEARNMSGGLTAPFYCGASAITTAGQRGSLQMSSDPCQIDFVTARFDYSAVLNPPLGDLQATITSTSEMDGLASGAVKVGRWQAVCMWQIFALASLWQLQ